MTFLESIKTCVKKWNDFDGRASRSEYWWFALLMVGLLLASLLFKKSFVLLIVIIVVLVPHLSVSIRRLHDTNESGWWILVGVIPYIGWLVQIVLLALPSKDPNRFDTQVNTLEKIPE